jgi:hypothetical protein
MPSQNEKIGLIAGNGKFPFLVLDPARAARTITIEAAQAAHFHGLHLSWPSLLPLLLTRFPAPPILAR